MTRSHARTPQARTIVPIFSAPCRAGEAGFLTLQGMAALALFAILAAALATAFQTVMQTLQKRAVASQLQQVATAAREYARAQGLLQSLTPGAAATSVDTETLVAAGAMPTPSTSPLRNAWGQEYRLYYYLPQRDDGRHTLVTVVLTTGGEAVDEARAVAAAMAGAGAGVVAERGASGTQQVGDILRGTGGGYAIPLGAAPMHIPSPGPGHIGYYVELDDAALLSDTLYRVAVPGRSELNQMQVDLDMRDHSLTDVHSVQFNATTVRSVELTTICGTSDEEKVAAEGKVFYYGGENNDAARAPGLYTCRSGTPWLVADAGNTPLLQKTYTVSPGTHIDSPICPAGQAPFISVAPATLPEGLTSGDSLHSYYTGAGTADDPWVVHLDINGQDTKSGTLSVITSCGGEQS